MSSPLNPRGSGASNAFTLIELLTVIAIIGVLAGITISVASGVKSRASASKARAELAFLSQALENYKRQYGDYPQVGGSSAANPDSSPDLGAITTGYSQAKLFNALTGKFGPLMAAMNGKVYIELSKFNLETVNLPGPNDNNDVANALIDPWGRRYMYYYKNPASPQNWKSPGYVLFSVGADGKVKANDPASDGVVDYEHADNLDNIYVNR